MLSALQVSQHLPPRLEYSETLHSGFDYNFNAIKDETNELFVAYKEMFEVAISQGRLGRTLLNIYLPYLSALFVSVQPNRYINSL